MGNFVRTWRVLEFTDEVLDGVDSLNLGFGLMLDDAIEDSHSFFGNIFLDLLLGIAIDQARFEVRENDVSDVELLVRVHSLIRGER